MRTNPFKNLMDDSKLGYALSFSLGFHMVIFALLPSMVFNHAAPLKEKPHNKVHLTILKKVPNEDSPKIKKIGLKPQSIRTPREILEVPKVLPKVAKSPRLVAHKQSPVLNSSPKVLKAQAMMRAPRKIPLGKLSKRMPIQKNRVKISRTVSNNIKTKTARKAPKEVQVWPTSSKASIRKTSPEVKITPMNPKVISDSRKMKQFASRPTHRRDSFRTNNVRINPGQKVFPLKRARTIERNSEGQTPTVLVSNTGNMIKRPDLHKRRQFSSIKQETSNSRHKAELIKIGHQGSKAIRVASFSPRAMTPVIMDEAPNESKLAPEAIDQLMNDFYLKVGRQIAYAKTYPDFAKKMGYQGKILVAFRINRDGKIVSLSVSKSSGYKILDEAALEAVKEAGPYPVIPRELDKKFLKLKIPISYAFR